jgi:chromate transporter
LLSCYGLFMTDTTSPKDTASLFAIFLRLGFTAFGGPIAHLAYFQHEFVEKRQWMTAQAYGQLVALCQFLPGPTSSQVGMAIGYQHSGYRGALQAWLGFTLPSAGMMLLAALALPLLQALSQSSNSLGHLFPQLLHHLGLLAMAVVLHAVWGMQRSLCPDMPRRALAVVTAVFLSLYHANLATWGWMLLLACVLWAWYRWRIVVPSSSAASTKTCTPDKHEPLGADVARITMSCKHGAAPLSPWRQSAPFLGSFVLLLALAFYLKPSPILNAANASAEFAQTLVNPFNSPRAEHGMTKPSEAPPLALSHEGLAGMLASSMYRSGALVIGGGHVILPLLQQELTQTQPHSSTTLELTGRSQAGTSPSPMPPPFVSDSTLLAGYALMQALPGPLFNLSAFVGATASLNRNTLPTNAPATATVSPDTALRPTMTAPASSTSPLTASPLATSPLTAAGMNDAVFTKTAASSTTATISWQSVAFSMGFASIAVVAIFLPGFLLLFAAWPWWQHWQHRADLRYVMQGLSAAIVGLMVAALIGPIQTHSIQQTTDYLWVLLGFLLLHKIAAWQLVLLVVLCSGSYSLL